MYPFFRLLGYLRRLSQSHEASPPRSAQREGNETHSCHAETPEQLEWSAPEIDPSSVTSFSALPEHLVDAVRRLKPFLPVGCELLAEGDLRVVGSRPIDAGGFADVWTGERNDGTVVAIKSHRYHSTSSCRSTYLVSHQRYQTAVCFTHWGPPSEIVPGGIDLQPPRRRWQEFCIVHRCLLHSRTPLCPRFHIHGSFESQRVSEG